MPDPPRLRVEVYEDAAQEWRWRLVARNGRTMAEESEGYASRANVLRALGVLSAYAGDAFTEACVWPDDHTS